MKELVEHIIKNIVLNNDSVQLIPEESDDKIIFRIKLEPSEIGKVIGKKGKVANSLKTILRASNFNNRKNIILEFDE